MTTLSYWDMKYTELLHSLCKEFPRNTKLYKVIADYILYLGYFGVPVPDSISEVPSDGYDTMDQARKDELWAAVAAWLNTAPKSVSEHGSMLYLAERFNIDGTHLGIVNFLFLYDRYSLFTEFFDETPEFKRVEFMRSFIGMPRNQLIEALRPSGELVLAGILSDHCTPHIDINRFNVRIALSQHVSYFLDDTHERTLSSFVLEEPVPGIFPLESFDLPKETLASARAALKRPGPAFILLYGEAGTGKTELSKALPPSCGLTPYFLQNDRNDGSRPVTALFIAANLIDPDREVLVVDECDTLLNTAEPNGPKAGPSALKSIFNQFLDRSRCKIIFITNQINGIPPSALRRMHILIGFKPANFKQRLRMWNLIDEKTSLFGTDACTALSLEYKANPARIRQVHEICSVLREQGNTQDLVVGAAKDMLARSGEVLYGTPYRKGITSEEIDPALLNLSLPANDLIARLGAWRDESETSKAGGLNLLFYGLPGTGKSAFARHLAQAVGLQPIVKRASDLLSPYVGETETLIRDAFEDAEGGALILDEADSFILDRKMMTRSWERTRTNEFLTQMDDFRGLFIATTNFSSVLDAASFRRFAFRLEFRSPLPDQRVELARRFFPTVSWAEDSIVSLQSLEGIVPGDYKAVSRRLAFSGPQDAKTIIAELLGEIALRSKSARLIGFGV